MELDAQPLAELGAVALVGVGRVAQPVVAVQRRDLPGTRDPHREVEQADRVAAAREQDQHLAAGLQQARRGDALE
jgi:hypothetical protein